MKRDHRDSCAGGGVGVGVGVGTSAIYGGSSGSTNPTTTSSASVGTECSSFCAKSKLWEEEQQAGAGAGMDELLAVLGYKVRSSDMVDVAQKLEQLEMVMGSAQEDGISQLSDTVHYNPSDLSVGFRACSPNSIPNQLTILCYLRPSPPPSAPSISQIPITRLRINLGFTTTIRSTISEPFPALPLTHRPVKARTQGSV
ncbi:hypothetical protein FNV43_RR13293 [Rhamnella rubrinervis]|uniref:Transcriptional factor DELLA N-terminal domain-containing protein n=1 Tax=Rhamnella rubrinervis TaxID=2594499 RepID=A0A8K0H0W3_9ROSA|nr:hypothetical protein FNV43_RR13293 [Rhamnella rubrinervis]